MGDEQTTKAARYMLEPTSQVTARVCRPDGTSVGVIDVQKASAYRDELNALLGQLEDARAEAARLRAAMMPLAEIVEAAEREAERLIENDECWTPLDDLGVSEVHRENADSIVPFDKALAAVRDAVLGPVERCERCGSRLLTEWYETYGDDTTLWWRGCYPCGSKHAQDVTSEHEEVGGGTDG